MRLLAAAASSLLATSLAAQASWSMLYPSGSPPPRNKSAMACFEPTGEVLLIGGMNGPWVTQSWKLQDSTWTPFQGPPTAYSRGMVFDSSRQRIVVFGGWAPTGPSNDVWEWNGSQWSNPSPVVRPTARAEFAMAFDRARGVTVVYGGSVQGGVADDLWEWNGTSWANRGPTPLGPRRFSLAAFDPVNADIIVHGGLLSALNSAIIFNDTWSWDGAAWTQRTPTTPPPYDDPALVTDLHRMRVVRYGGIAGGTWEWDGSEWTTSPTPSPGPRLDHAIAYDTSGRRVVTFGGTSIGYWVQDTWIYRTPMPADVAPFGAGCAGSVGTPALAAAPYTLPWLGDTMRNVVQTIPAGEPGALFVSSIVSTLPLPLAFAGAPGCDLLVQPDVVEFRAAIAGKAEWVLPVPNVPALAGAMFWQQAFVFDAAANALGLAASNGVVVTLGVR